MFANQAYAPDHFKVHPEKGELRGIFHSSRAGRRALLAQVDLVG